MNIEDVFRRGLHKLTNEQLMTLANSQEVLLNDVTNHDLVYLVQEMASRIEDLAEHRAAVINREATECND